MADYLDHVNVLRLAALLSEDGNVWDLWAAFCWSDTAQGHKYWTDIAEEWDSNDDYKLSEDDRTFLQELLETTLKDRRKES